jgi:hypothetical protein
VRLVGARASLGSGVANGGVRGACDLRLARAINVGGVGGVRGASGARMTSDAIGGASGVGLGGARMDGDDFSWRCWRCMSTSY